jgi:putative membrane protein
MSVSSGARRARRAALLIRRASPLATPCGARAMVAGALAVLATQARAHGLDASGAPDVARATAVTLLCVGALLYARGLGVLWGRAGIGAGIRRAHAVSFTAGIIVLGGALVSALDTLAARLFSAHMVQHELMMVVAAPLLVLGRPLATWAWGLPERLRTRLWRATHWGPIAHAWSVLVHPLGAWSLHAVVLWVWHVPALFLLALAHPWWHFLQHASFLASAALFWWPVVQQGRARAPSGVAIVYLFTTMLHTGALGALLAFAGSAWYHPNPAATLPYDLTALEDQQLAGLVMWIPAGAVYVIAALYLMHRWLRESPATDAQPPRAAEPLHGS